MASSLITSINSALDDLEMVMEQNILQTPRHYWFLIFTFIFFSIFLFPFPWFLCHIKMSSSLITSINSALDDLEMVMDSENSAHSLHNDLLELRFKLRNLKTFVHFATKLGNNVVLRSNKAMMLETFGSFARMLGYIFPWLEKVYTDGSLGSLLLRIEDGVGRNAEDWRYFFVRFHFIPNQMVNDFLDDIESLEKGIGEWYISISDYTRRRSSSDLAADEVVEITDSIIKSLVDFSSFRSPDYPGDVLQQMEILRENLTFLKNFFLFIAQRGVEQRQMEVLLVPTETVTIDAAYLIFLCPVNNFTMKCRKQMELTMPILLQRIKPNDPQTYETYTRALHSSKLARSQHPPTPNMDCDAIIVMKNFLDCLISDLWEMLRLDTFPLVYRKNQLQVLYEGLRFLRTILKQQPNNFDQKTRDQIGDAVCDAGVIIFSFYQANVDVELGLDDISETIKVIREEVGEKVPQVSIFNFSRTIELGFVDFIVENLMEMTSGTAEPISKSHAQAIQEELVFLRSFMGEIVELRHEQDKLQALWNRVLEVACRVEILIDHILVGDTSASFSSLYDSIIEDIGSIKAEALKISHGKMQDIHVKSRSGKSSHVPSQSTPSITSEVVGFREEAKSITDRLTRGSKHLRIVAIVGMPGIGKTTLAIKVYNDPTVIRHFHVRAWCLVSQVLDKKNLLLMLLNHIKPDKYSDMNEEDLADKLRRCLKQRRYLILLDDVWNLEAWKSLDGSFPDDSVGSRIILTSRIHDVAPPAMLDQAPHILRQLNKKESLELLQRKIFPGQIWPPALHDLGMQIVENCKGLALTIVIVAGLLATTEQKDWKEIVDILSSGGVSSTEQCRSTLELSYKYLPDYLKPCLLYFGAFAEDQEVPVRPLIRLWIAEGFIRKTKTKSLEDVAEDYMMELIGRSLIMVGKQRSIGGIKSCRIHDLLHDFCLQKAKDEHFLHVLKGSDELLSFNEPGSLRRICIHSMPEHFKESMLFCPRARSLLFFSQETKLHKEDQFDIAFVTQIFKLLKVLYFEQVHVGSLLPKEIEQLVQLRYLAIRGEISVIPSSIGNLSNLETFIVDSGFEEKVLLPETLWNLRKLKYLYIRKYHCVGASLPTENLDHSSGLYELDRFSGAIFPSPGKMIKQLRKFPNIRKLKCTLFEHWNDAKNIGKILVPDFLSKLESLHMSPMRSEFWFRVQFELGLPENLKKLALSGFWLPWSRISTIAKLPNLEVLKLLKGSFEGSTWEMEEGDFSKLRFLKLSGLEISNWTASGDPLQCLQTLVLEECDYLEEIPRCLDYISTLEMIEVRYCPHRVARLLEHIQEEQVNLGNSGYETVIRPRIFGKRDNVGF